MSEDRGVKDQNCSRLLSSLVVIDVVAGALVACYMASGERARLEGSGVSGDSSQRYVVVVAVVVASHLASAIITSAS